MSFAKVTIVGRLGSEPELRYTKDGASILSFRMAADGKRRDQETTWFAVSAFDRHAERLVSLQEKGHLSKGSLLYVEGQLSSRPYTDRNGQQRTSLDVTLTDWQFVGGGQQPTRQEVPADDMTLNDIPF